MQILLTAHFKKQLGRLARKFPHVANDLKTALENFKPEKEIHIHRSVFKIRIKSYDLKKGKSGGFRAYVYFHKNGYKLIPLCIYIKSEIESISDDELQRHIYVTSLEITLFDRK